MFTVRLACLFLALPVLRAAPPQRVDNQASKGPWTLAWSWQPGWVHEMEAKTETRLLDPASQPAHLPSLLQVRQRTSLAVRSGAQGERRVEIRIQSIDGEVHRGGEVERFDSRRPTEASTQVRALLRSVGEGFVLKYSQDGGYLGMEGLAVPSVNEGQWADLLELAARRQSAELFEQSLRWGLPFDQVTPGQSWDLSGTLRFPSSGEVEVSGKATLQQVRMVLGKPEAQIVFSGRLATLAEDRGARTVSVGDGSSLQGSLTWDLHRGLLLRSDQRTTLHLQLRDRKLPLSQRVQLRLLGSSQESNPSELKPGGP